MVALSALDAALSQECDENWCRSSDHPIRRLLQGVRSGATRAADGIRVEPRVVGLTNHAAESTSMFTAPGAFATELRTGWETQPLVGEAIERCHIPGAEITASTSRRPSIRTRWSRSWTRSTGGRSCSSRTSCRAGRRCRGQAGLDAVVGGGLVEDVLVGVAVGVGSVDQGEVSHGGSAFKGVTRWLSICLS